MSTTIEIKVSGDAQEYLGKVSNRGAVLPAVARTLDDQNQLTVGHIFRRYVSFPSDSPVSQTTLRTKTGGLRRSIRQSYPKITGDGIVSAIGSNVEYAAILEEGGTTAPHVILPKRKKALAFGGRVYGKVNHPGSRITGRHFVRRGIEDRLNDYSSAIASTIIKL